MSIGSTSILAKLVGASPLSVLSLPGLICRLFAAGPFLSFSSHGGFA